MIDKTLKMIIDFSIGDGYIDGHRKESRIRIEHASKQEQYAKHKYQRLLDAGLPVNIRHYSPRNGKNVGKWYYQINSRQHPLFTTAYKWLYNKGKKGIDKALLRQLDAESLAYWFMDDGYAKHSTVLRRDDKLYKYNRAVTTLYGLATDSFTYEENVLICDWIREKFDIWARPAKHSKTTWRIYFQPIAAKEKLKAIIEPFILSDMFYKIEAPHSFRDIPFEVFQWNGVDFIPIYEIITA